MKKVHRVYKVNQNAWLKPCINMNLHLKKKAKDDFEKDFFKWMNNAVFGKTMENVRKHRDFKLVITERRRNYLVSQPNCHTTKFLTENSLAIEMKKSEIPMNKPACLGLSMLELCKILMYEFCYDCVKSKHSEKSKLCYIETESSIVYIKTDESYRNIADDVETKLDT